MKSIFFANFLDQKNTVEELTKESRADSDFYVFLAGSSIITTLGLILNSSIIIIGGMLVAPLLFPILSLGMGIATSSTKAIGRSLKIIGQSVFLVFIISFTIAFLVNGKEPTQITKLASTVGLEHFLIAIISGIVASFAWVKRNVNASLPGVAVSVSLIPPLSAFSIGVSILDKDIIAGSALLFLINLIGIVFAGLFIFSLFGFSNLQKVQEKVIKKEKKEEEKKEEGTENTPDGDGITVEEIETINP